MLDVQVTLPRDYFQVLVTHTFDAQHRWGIMGSSGCGKTSLLRSLAGLESKAQGRIQYFDEVWQDTEKGIWVPPEQRGIGYIFQEARLFSHMDVMGNLEFAQRRAKPYRSRSSFSDVVEQLGIENLLSSIVGKLSGGEKQRVALARTLLNAPRLLLMDEPLASLDWTSKLNILPTLRDIHQNFHLPVIMVSHSQDEVARFADRLLVMDRGNVVTSGSCAQLLNSSGSLLASDDRALSVLEAIVVRHEPEYGLTELSLDNHTVVVSQIDAEEGESVRLILPAHEVSLFLYRSNSTSVQNRLPVEVTAFMQPDVQHVLISLKLMSQFFQALITKKSFQELSLKKGVRLYAHFKASCLDVF